MQNPRRLTAALAAAALVWTGLALGVGAPAAQADSGNRDAPHDPATYYAGTEGLSAAALAAKLNEIIDGHTKLTYAQVYDELPTTDEDPDNPSNLIDFYSGASLPKSPRCGSGDCTNLWNREHSWPQSHGGLGTAAGPGTDLFHMRPELGGINSTRGNLDFDESDNPYGGQCPPCSIDGNSFEPRPAIKGDLARGLFYMAVRYNGDATDEFGVDLEMADSSNTDGRFLGKLSTLVAWSLADPPDALERARNDLIDGNYQHNRNPFIDHPEWVCSIWGSSVPAPTCATPPNVAPTTSAMTGTTPEDTATTVALTATDPDGDTLTWSLDAAQPAAHGAAGVTGSTLSYTPAANYNGPDEIGVIVSDGRGGSASTTVTITVSPVNDAPVATAASVTTAEDTAQVITLAGTDADGDGLTYAIATQPAHGTVNLTDNQATYTPVANYHGPDSVTFTVNDGTMDSAPATVSINLTPVNDAPTVTASQLSTTFGSPVTATLAASDVDGDPVTILAVTTPAHGSVTFSGRAVTYTPTSAGSDGFVVTVSDGNGAIATAPVGVAVAKAAAQFKISGGSLQAGKPGTIKVKLTGVTGVAPTGKVKLKVNGRTLTANLKNGVATFKIAKLPDAAQLKVKAKYLGDGQYSAGSLKKAFTL